jgi:hypothetical protein
VGPGAGPRGQTHPDGTRLASAGRDQAKQNRLDALMDKNNEGLLTSAERKELKALVRDAEEIALSNARELAEKYERKSAFHSLRFGLW